MVALETHLTRDLTDGAFISPDYTWLDGGERTFNNDAAGIVVLETGGLNAHLLGATLGFEVNDNLRLYLTHMQTTSTPDFRFALQGAATKVTLAWAWHPVLEQIRRLGAE